MSVQRYFFNFVARLLVPPGEIHVSPGGTPADRQKNLYDRAVLNPITSVIAHCHFPTPTAIVIAARSAYWFIGSSGPS